MVCNTQVSVLSTMQGKIFQDLFGATEIILFVYLTN